MSDLLICWSADLLICWSPDLQICWIAKLLSCWAAELLICWSAHLLICSSADLLICSAADLLICWSADQELLICWSAEVLNYWSDDLLICCSSVLICWSDAQKCHRDIQHARHWEGSADSFLIQKGLLCLQYLTHPGCKVVSPFFSAAICQLYSMWPGLKRSFASFMHSSCIHNKHKQDPKCSRGVSKTCCAPLIDWALF